MAAVRAVSANAVVCDCYNVLFKGLGLGLNDSETLKHSGCVRQGCNVYFSFFASMLTAVDGVPSSVP